MKKIKNENEKKFSRKKKSTKKKSGENILNKTKKCTSKKRKIKSKVCNFFVTQKTKSYND
jgi:hypothetical protein